MAEEPLNSAASPASGREMYDEVTAMVNAIAKALEIEPEAAAKAIEEGRVQLNLATGPSGERLVLVAMDGRTALIAANAIERAPATNPSSCHNDQ